MFIYYLRITWMESFAEFDHLILKYPRRSATKIYSFRFFSRNLFFKTVSFLQSYLYLRITHSRQNLFITLGHRSAWYFYTTFTTSYNLIILNLNRFLTLENVHSRARVKLLRSSSGVVLRFLKRLRFRGLSLSVDR